MAWAKILTSDGDNFSIHKENKFIFKRNFSNNDRRKILRLKFFVEFELTDVL